MLLGVLSLAAAAGAATVDSSTRALAAREGRITVVVALRAGASRTRTLNRDEIRGVRERVIAAANPADVRVTHSYEFAAGFAAEVTAAGIDQLAQDPAVLRIDPDMEGYGALAGSVPQIRADRVHARGLDGRGVVIAMFDTGVDVNHEDLAGSVIHEECFCSSRCCPNRRSRQSGFDSARSRHPHGVHVAGVALSRGRLGPPGVAPGASLIALRVLDDENRGRASDWIAALDWLAANRPDVNVVNLSLVTKERFAGACDEANAVTMMLRDLIGVFRRRGVPVIAASGNDGSTTMLNAPACLRDVIAVGAVDSADNVASFSNAGEALDLLAPGVTILGPAPEHSLITRSGTSTATPFVTGTVALLRQMHPEADVAQIENALKGGGNSVRDARTGQSFPRVNALGALRLLAAEASAQLGGGSEQADCLLQWRFVPPSAVALGLDPMMFCDDGDPACDIDRINGQCTLLLSLCFNARSPALPRCAVDDAIVSFEARWPRAMACIGDCDRDGEVTIGDLVRMSRLAVSGAFPFECSVGDPNGDFAIQSDELITAVNNSLRGCAAVTEANMRALRDALPGFPLRASHVCSFPFPLSVPAGAEIGTATARATVRSSSRRDYDRVTFVCRGGGS